MQKLPPRTMLNACWRWRQNINRDGTRHGKNRRNAWSRIYRSVSSTTTSDRYLNTAVQSMDHLCNHKLIFKSLQSEPNLNCLILYNPFCNLFLSLKRTKCFTLLYIWSFISCFFILSNFQIHSEIDELHQHLQARRGSYGNSLPAARMNSQAFKQFEMTVEVKKNVDELFQISWI